MSGFLSIPILIIAAVLQVTVMPQISFLGGRPDLIFLLVLSWSLNSTLEQAVIWAFVGGICKDLLSAAPLGMSTLGLLCIIFLIFGIRQQLFAVGLFTLIWSTLVGTIVTQSMTIGVLLVSGFQPAFADQLGYGVVLQQIQYYVLPTVVYNLIVIFPTYLFIRWVQRRFAINQRSIR
jgi:rod shape-determining protein MreD